MDTGTSVRDEPRPLQAHAGSMRWTRLLFLHWPVAPAALAQHVPSELEIDTFDGRGWIGVVPFGMEDVRVRCMPALPGASDFPELNLRTYVRHRGRPGIWFFSLDAASRLAVRGARCVFGLPYFDAEMAIDVDGARVSYRSERTHRGTPAARFRASWVPHGDARMHTRMSLEHFLTARCRLFSKRRGTLLVGEIDHPAWLLQGAEVELAECTLSKQLGIALQGAPHVLYADSVDVDAWAPQRLST